MGLVEDVMVGLCVTVKTKVCNYGMVELMFWWLGAVKCTPPRLRVLYRVATYLI